MLDGCWLVVDCKDSYIFTNMLLCAKKMRRVYPLCAVVGGGRKWLGVGYSKAGWAGQIRQCPLDGFLRYGENKKWTGKSLCGAREGVVGRKRKEIGIKRLTTFHAVEVQVRA